MDNNKTQKTLLKENDQLRARIGELKKSESKYKKIEKALKESEEKYKGIIHSTANCIAVYKPIDNGKDFVFVDFNPMAEKTEQISKDKVIGKKVTEVFPGVVEFGLFQVFQNVWKSGKPEHFPLSVYKDKRIMGYKENYVYKLASGEIVAVYRDLTERKKIEEELKKSEHIRNILLDNLPIVTLILKKQTREIVACNKLAKERGAVVGKTCYETLLKCEHTCPFCQAHKLWETNEYQQIEAEYMGRHWEGRWISYTDDLYIHYIYDITKTKQVEQELKEREAFNFALFQNNPIATVVVDTEGRIVENNLKQLSDNRQPKKGDIMYRDYAGKHDIDMYNVLMECMKSGETKDFPRMKYKEKYLKITIAPFIHGAIITSQDITEKTKAEADLQEKTKETQLLSEMLDSSSQPFAIGSIDGRLTKINPAFCELTGYSEEELLSDISWNETLTPQEWRDYEGKILNEFLANGKPQFFEKEYIRKDGKRISVELLMNCTIDTDNNIQNVYGFINDITKRKQIMESLKESEYLLKESQKMASLGSYVLDITGGGIWRSSLILDDIFGIDQEYIKDIPGWQKIIHPEDRAMMQDYFASNVLANHKSFNKEYRINRINDQQERWVHGLGEVEFNDDGNPLKMIGTIQDITDRKQIEEELKTERTSLSKKVKERTAELEKANKLKDEFLANMSHELRTPLNSIIALSHVLAKQTKDKLSEEENSYLEIVERNGKQLLLLINDILDLSKIVAGKIEILLKFISVGDLLHIIKENIQSNAEEKGLALTLSVPVNMPKVENDESKLNQILTNVIGNAVKFTEKGGVDISVKHDSENIFIEVKDSGIGISNEMLPHIFDEFKQADSSVTHQYGGTGLGLAIAKKMTLTLCGDIEVKSKLDKGSVFTITIPIIWAGEKQIKVLEI